jgi:hypothetical protein
VAELMSKCLFCGTEFTSKTNKSTCCSKRCYDYLWKRNNKDKVKTNADRCYQKKKQKRNSIVAVAEVKTEEQPDNRIPMDQRCPRKLKYLPDTWCPLSVLRIKMIRLAGRELTEDEENMLPGCPWQISSQLSNYCFFNYVQLHLPENTMSDAEIAHLLNFSIDTVKRLNRVGFKKIKNSAMCQEL